MGRVKHADVNGMFSGAPAFNSALSKLDVSNLKDTSFMFSGATTFDHDLSEWDVSSVTDTCVTLCIIATLCV